jgi:arginyl-tRNA synthetase
VVRLIEQFPSVVTGAIDRSEPSQVTRFAVDLAQAYNKFYFERRILDDDPGARAARLALTGVTRDLIKTALYLIGIESPARM